jgi:hypothetical protein
MRALCARRVAAAFAKTGTKRFVFVFVFVLRTVPSFASCASTVSVTASASNPGDLAVGERPDLLRLRVGEQLLREHVAGTADRVRGRELPPHRPGDPDGRALARRRRGGHLAAAMALAPWIDQAYGKPTERVERKYPSSIDDLEQMDEEQLARLVAEGRRQRLAAQGLQSVPDPSDWRRRDPSLGVIDG